MNLKNLVTPIRDVPSTWKRRLLIVFWGIVLPPLFVLMALFVWIYELGQTTKEAALETWEAGFRIVNWYRHDLRPMWSKSFVFPSN